jgi:serine/threonine-protein kinase
VITIGHLIAGKYRLLRQLGDGGMGAVYEATHERLGTRVAVKILHPDIASRPGIVDRFLQEAKVAAQIRSPHVVTVSDVDQTQDGYVYLVMELLEGEPLAALVDRQGKLPVAIACEYTRQILAALEAAHAIGVVHRDLKPDNVFVTHMAGKPVLKLIDFGIAKVRREGVKNLTMAGVMMGTAEYMAPEQAYSADTADARSDVFSVGVMLYEMLAGQRPATGDDARIVALKIERGEVTPLVHVAPEVPQKLAGLVHRAMAPRPEMRFATATEMRLALEQAMEGLPAGVEPAPPPAAPPIDPRLMQVPATTTTVRAAPLPEPERTPPPGPWFEATQRATPVGLGGPPPEALSPPPMTPPPQITYAPAPSRPAPRRGGGGTWLLVLLAVLLGGGIVVGIVLLRGEGDGETPLPLPTTPTASTVATLHGADAAPQPTGTLEPLKPLTVPTQVATGPRPTATARTDAGPADEAGAPTTPTVPTMPTLPPFPSTLPFPLPEGGTFTLPSGFPPLFPPAPPPQ